MTIETIGPVEPIISINGKPYMVNVKEYESLINQCQKFMDVDANSFQEMTQIISDQLIDFAKDDAKIYGLRAQLKFLREIGFFFKGIVTPLTGPDQHLHSGSNN